MPTLTITKTYSNGTVLSEGQLDDAFNSVSTFVNTTKLGSDNIQSSAVGTTQLNDASVTTAKLANNAVTDAKLSSSNSDDSARAVSTNSVKDSAITTAKLADGAVTQAKRAALGQQISTTLDLQGVNSPVGYTALTNLSVSITTTGRPVMLKIQSSGTEFDSGNISLGGTLVSSGQCRIAFYRAGSPIAFHATVNNTPMSAFSFIDTPSAGTYTYSVYMNGVGTVAACKLVAFEL